MHNDGAEHLWHHLLILAMVLSEDRGQTLLTSTTAPLPPHYLYPTSSLTPPNEVAFNTTATTNAFNNTAAAPTTTIPQLLVVLDK
jgi:hypothetical protein